MKRKIVMVLLAGALALAAAPRVARPDVAVAAYAPSADVSVSVFYSDLAPWGRWVDVSPYGWCWAPDIVYAGWRPYSDGGWVYSDFGWTWVSDEPWAWAAYHYGRWFYDPYYGWVWLPGTEWAPAWVVWRTDLDWVGWAPLPPSTGWSAWFEVRSSNFAHVEPRAWCFTRARDLSARNLRDRIVPVARNAGLIRRTRDVTNYGRHDGRPFNRGVDVAALERRAGGKFARYEVRDASGPRSGRFRGREVVFYRPKVERARPGEAPRMQDRGARRERDVALERRGQRPADRPNWRREERPPAESPQWRRDAARPQERPEVRRKAPQPPAEVRKPGRRDAERGKKPDRRRGNEEEKDRGGSGGGR